MVAGEGELKLKETKYIGPVDVIIQYYYYGIREYFFYLMERSRVGLSGCPVQILSCGSCFLEKELWAEEIVYVTVASTFVICVVPTGQCPPNFQQSRGCLSRYPYLWYRLPSSKTFRS
jgi:hypothetical protein